MKLHWSTRQKVVAGVIVGLALLLLTVGGRRCMSPPISPLPTPTLDSPLATPTPESPLATPTTTSPLATPTITSPLATPAGQ